MHVTLLPVRPRSGCRRPRLRCSANRAVKRRRNSGSNQAGQLAQIVKNRLRFKISKLFDGRDAGQNRDKRHTGASRGFSVSNAIANVKDFRG